MHHQRNVALDGLRGIAVLMVVCHHGLPDIAMSSRILEWFKKLLLAGWVGVDLFFVLSGFLITGILLRAKSSPHFFRNFYARRVLRIWPPYLFCVSLVVVWLYLQDPVSELLAHQGFLWFHAVNLGMLLHPDVFRSQLMGVSHMWSLAVEEHFYLFWPLLVYRLKVRSLQRCIVVLLVLTLAVRTIAVWFHQPPFFFVQSFCRMDALAVGALLATWFQEDRIPSLQRPAQVVATLSGLACLAFFFLKKGFWAWDPLIFSFGLSVVYLLFASLFVLVLNGLGSGLLQNRFLRTCGKYSYGWYLLNGILHPSINRLIESSGLSAASMPPELWAVGLLVIGSAIPFAAAWVMFAAIELPFLRLKSRFAD